MTREEKILFLLETYADQKGLKPGTVAQKAGLSPGLYGRLKNGGYCRSEMLERLLSWFDEVGFNYKWELFSYENRGEAEDI